MTSNSRLEEQQYYVDITQYEQEQKGTLPETPNIGGMMLVPESSDADMGYMAFQSPTNHKESFE